MLCDQMRVNFEKQDGTVWLDTDEKTGETVLQFHPDRESHWLPINNDDDWYEISNWD
jgi:hypothetical protein